MRILPALEHAIPFQTNPNTMNKLSVAGKQGPVRIETGPANELKLRSLSSQNLSGGVTEFVDFPDFQADLEQS